MRKKTLGFISVLLLGLLHIGGAIMTIIRDTGVDLSKADVVIERVVKAQLTTRIVKGVKYSKGQTIFCFRLANSIENFAVFRSDQGYWMLEDNIQVGDTLKVFYSPSSSRYNLDVYQIEKGSVLIHDYRIYEDQASTASAVLLFSGIIIVTVGT